MINAVTEQVPWDPQATLVDNDSPSPNWDASALL